MVAKYVPDAGDVVWLHFDPQAGHEQAGHLPALVLSAKQYNEMVALKNKLTAHGYYTGHQAKAAFRHNPSLVM